MRYILLSTVETQMAALMPSRPSLSGFMSIRRGPEDGPNMNVHTFLPTPSINGHCRTPDFMGIGCLIVRIWWWMDSVLKSGPVRFFAFFGCNRTKTGPKKSAELRNRNRNRMQLRGRLQPVPTGCLPDRSSTSCNLQLKVCIHFLLFTDY